MMKTLTEEELCLSLRKLREAAERGLVVTPINLCIAHRCVLHLPQLKWFNFHLSPDKMRVTNTGYTVILSAKWSDKRPYINQGPLSGNYVFSQVHFHWGQTDERGSEHFVDGKQYPLEMHVVYYKSEYERQDIAVRQKDGLFVVGYFFKIEDVANPTLEEVVRSFASIAEPLTSAPVNAFRPDRLGRPFRDDYFLYHGSVTSAACNHQVLWAFNREPVSVSRRQVARFRLLRDVNGAPLMLNSRQADPARTHPIFHVNPSPIRSGFLYPLSTAMQPARPGWGGGGGKRRGSWDEVGVEEAVAEMLADDDCKQAVTLRPRDASQSSGGDMPSPSELRRFKVRKPRLVVVNPLSSTSNPSAASPAVKKPWVTVYNCLSYDPPPVKPAKPARPRANHDRSIRDQMHAKAVAFHDGGESDQLICCDESETVTTRDRTSSRVTATMINKLQGQDSCGLICNDEPVKKRPNGVDSRTTPNQSYLMVKKLRGHDSNQLICNDALAETKANKVDTSTSSNQTLATDKKRKIDSVAANAKMATFSEETKSSCSPAATSRIAKSKAEARDRSRSYVNRDRVAGDGRSSYVSVSARLKLQNTNAINDPKKKPSKRSSHALDETTIVEILHPGKNAVGRKSSEVVNGFSPSHSERLERIRMASLKQADLIESKDLLIESKDRSVERKDRSVERKDRAIQRKDSFVGRGNRVGLAATSVAKEVSGKSGETVGQKTEFPSWSMAHSMTITKMVNYCKKLKSKKPSAGESPMIEERNSSGEKEDKEPRTVKKKGEDDLCLVNRMQSTIGSNRSDPAKRASSHVPRSHSGQLRLRKATIPKPQSAQRVNHGQAAKHKSKAAEGRSAIESSRKCSQVSAANRLLKNVSDTSFKSFVDVLHPVSDKSKSKPNSEDLDFLGLDEGDLYSSSERSRTRLSKVAHPGAARSKHCGADPTSAQYVQINSQVTVLMNQIQTTEKSPFSEKPRPVPAWMLDSTRSADGSTNASCRPVHAGPSFDAADVWKLQALAEESSKDLLCSTFSNKTFTMTETFSDLVDLDRRFSAYRKIGDALDSGCADDIPVSLSRRAGEQRPERLFVGDETELRADANAERARWTALNGRPKYEEFPDRVGSPSELPKRDRDADGMRPSRVRTDIGRPRVVSPVDERSREVSNLPRRPANGYDGTDTDSDTSEFLALDNDADNVWSDDFVNVELTHDGLALRDGCNSALLSFGLLDDSGNRDAERNGEANKVSRKFGRDMEARKPAAIIREREVTHPAEALHGTRDAWRPQSRDIMASRPQSRDIMASRAQSSISGGSIVKKLKQSKSLWPSRPLCWGRGRLQSPIAISRDTARHIAFPPLAFHFHFATVGQATLRNMGNRAEMKFKGQKQPFVSGGPLVDGRYLFESLSVHWYSAADTSANQHSVDNTYYTTEVHLVHYMHSWSSYEHAVKEPHGVAIVAFFLESGSQEDLYFEDLVSALAKIPHPGSSTKLSVETMKFLERSVPPTGYFSYPGSLTDTPYSDDVVWIVYPEPIVVSAGQIDQFRTMSNHACSFVKPNNRSQQPLNERPVFYAI